MKMFLIIATLMTAQMSFAQRDRGPHHGNPNVYLSQGQTLELLPYQRTTVTCGDSQGSVRPVNPELACQLAGPGAFSGYNRKYRISQKNNAIYGTDNFQELITQTAALDANGICQIARGNCSMAGAGAFSGYNRKYRIAINDVVVHGTDDSNESMQAFSELRKVGLCH